MRTFPRMAAAIAAVACSTAVVCAARAPIVLPGGWRLEAPQGAVVNTGTMPQGIALSPDGTQLAVVESGVDAPVLRIFAVPALTQTRAIELPGAFGKPVWADANDVLVAGGNADAALRVALDTASVTHALDAPKDSWTVAVARSAQGAIAAVGDDGTLSLGTSEIPVGDHPADLVFSPDGSRLYVALRRKSEVAVVDVAAKRVASRIAAGLHPGALALSADGSTLYVAQSDADSLGRIDTRSLSRLPDVRLGFHTPRMHTVGASPNAIALRGNDVYVSLGAENAIARVRGGRLMERIPTGWYPTGVAFSTDGTLYESNGDGEGPHANPQFRPGPAGDAYYVAHITVGSIRELPPQSYGDAAAQTLRVVDAANPLWTPLPVSRTILHAGGPIAHVIYIIKENRTYDQVLGDVPNADGAPQLAAFGARVTPNQHALARRFGIFDNAYTDAEVSASGHNWTDASFSNDYVERFWPPNYGGRRETYDFATGGEPSVPPGGYLWDAAKAAHLTYRDYGEYIEFPRHGMMFGLNSHPGLTGHFDPRYVGWDLQTPDSTRYAEWKREFDAFVTHRDLPALEVVYMPNDHTSGTRAGYPTPQAYVAMNDQAVGRIVQSVSRSPYWQNTAIFVLEDDAQNGPDHVSDQRSTFYIASPYARGGVRHAHYSTASFVHTIELILGMKPMSIYDATARPLYDAFAMSPVNSAPFTLLSPGIDLDAVNKRTAYGAQLSARLDFSQPDAADERVLDDILMHATQR